jgi:DNA phosphorothioation-dependent restriction protein DptG
MPSATPEIDGETTGRTHPGRVRCDWGTDYVSQTNDTDDKVSTYRCIDHRSVAEMRRKVGKRSKRNAVLRFILARGDKDEIAAWNQDLVRLLHVFNVRPIDSMWNPQT